MSVQNFEGMRELVMAPEKAQLFEEGFKALRGTLIRQGFAQEAVDSLQFKATEHMMFISPEERKGGAWHIHADGQPFYAIQMSAPGSMMELAGLDLKSPTKLTPQQQASFLAVELCVNILPKMGQALDLHYNNTVEKRAGGGEFSPFENKIETTMRADPKAYCQVLNEFLGLRLDQIAPKAPTVSAPKSAAGTVPGGGAPA